MNTAVLPQIAAVLLFSPQAKFWGLSKLLYLTKRIKHVKNRQKKRKNRDCKMSNNNEILARIALMKDGLRPSAGNAETSGFANKPKLEEKVNGFEVLSPMQEYAVVQSPSKSDMRAIDFGFELAKGSSENVRVDNYVIKDLPPYRPNNIASILKDKGSRE